MPDASAPSVVLSLRVLPALADIGLQSALDAFEEQIIVERLFDEASERTGLHGADSATTGLGKANGQL